MLRFSASLSSDEAEDKALDRRAGGVLGYIWVGLVAPQSGPFEAGGGRGAGWLGGGECPLILLLSPAPPPILLPPGPTWEQSRVEAPDPLEPDYEVGLSPLCFLFWAQSPSKAGNLRSVCSMGFGIRWIRVDISDLTDLQLSDI